MAAEAAAVLAPLQGRRELLLAAHALALPDPFQAESVDALPLDRDAARHRRRRLGVEEVVRRIRATLPLLIVAALRLVGLHLLEPTDALEVLRSEETRHVEPRRRRRGSGRGRRRRRRLVVAAALLVVVLLLLAVLALLLVALTRLTVELDLVLTLALVLLALVAAPIDQALLALLAALALALALALAVEVAEVAGAVVAAAAVAHLPLRRLVPLLAARAPLLLVRSEQLHPRDAFRDA